MFAVSAAEVLGKRKRGPVGKFETQEAKIALLLFLNDPSKTYKDAAAHFQCSIRTIDYAVKAIRKEQENKESGPGNPKVSTPETRQSDATARAATETIVADAEPDRQQEAS